MRKRRRNGNARGAMRADTLTVLWFHEKFTSDLLHFIFMCELYAVSNSDQLIIQMIVE